MATAARTRHWGLSEMASERARQGQRFPPTAGGPRRPWPTEGCHRPLNAGEVRWLSPLRTGGGAPWHAPAEG